MALADRLEEATPRKGPQCRLCLEITHMTPKDRKTLTDWLADPTVYSTTIARALQLEGHRIHGTTVARHRAGHV
jgi:hypothetical protein